MHARTARLPLCAAGLAAILAAALAGCAAGGSGASGTARTASASPLAVVRLAAKTTDGASSFTGTMHLTATAKGDGAPSGAVISMSGSMTERLRPSVLAQVQIGSISEGGQTVPGGMSEVITPSDLYLKYPALTQELGTSKPWVVMPVSALSKSTGVNFSQLFSQSTSTSPLNESQLLAGASNVRKVGTGTIDGVPVTEYAGSISLDKGLPYLTGSFRASMQKEIAEAGLTSAAFTVWVDGQTVMRKAVITENGTMLSEVVTVTISSLNQPVNIQVPAADQTTPMPSSALGSLGS
jgi:hypothetical protein